MANVPPYKRSYSFEGYQTQNPSRPLPGVRVDIEFDNIADNLAEFSSYLDALEVDPEAIHTVATNIGKVVQVSDNMDAVLALPQQLSDAQDAADTATDAADRSEGYADRSELAAEAASRAPSSWSDFQSPLFKGYLDGVIVSFNGADFRRDRSANIANLPAGQGWGIKDAISPEHFGAVGNGVAVDTVPFQRVGEAMTAGVSSHLRLRAGARYLVGSSCNIYNRNGIVVDLNGAQMDGSLFPKTSSGWMFRVESQNQVGEATAVTGGSLARGSKTIPVANGSLVKKGDTIVLQTDEPFSGIAGVSGFQPRFKGEFCEVDRVSGNTITTVNPLRDSYSSSYARTVYRQGMIEGVVIKNGSGVGYGHVQDWTSDENPTGVRMFRISNARNVLIHQLDLREFSRFAGEFVRCINAFVDHCHVWGVDKSREWNDSTAESVWYTGFQFGSCENFGVRNSSGNYLRRIMDFDGSGSTGPMCRNAIQIGCTLTRCYNGAGSHSGEGYLIIGNAFDRCYTAVNSRAKNVTIIGNRGTVINRAMSFGRIMAQGTASQTELSVDFGHWFVDGNTIESIGATNPDFVDAVTVQGGIFRSLVFTNNSIRHTSYYGMGLSFTRCDVLHVDGNRFAATGGGRVGVCIQNISGALAKFPLGSVSRNAFSGYSRANILSEGYGSASNLAKVGGWWDINNTFDVSGNHVLSGAAILLKLGDFSGEDAVASGTVDGFHPAFNLVGNVTRNTLATAAAAIVQAEDRQLLLNIPVGGLNAGAGRSKLGIPMMATKTTPCNILAGTQVSLTGGGTENNLATCVTEGTRPALSWTNGVTTAGSPDITFSASVAGTMRVGMFITVPNVGTGGEDVLTRVIAISANGRSVTTSGGIVSAATGLTVSTRPYVLKRPVMEDLP